MTLKKKKALQYSLDFEYYEKFKFLQKKMKRNGDSDMSRFIIEHFIDDYEETNGQIKTEN